MARDFDGSTGYLTSGGTPNLVNNSLEISVSAWVNLDSISADQKIAAQWATSTFSWLLAIAATTGRVGFGVGGQGPGIWLDNSTNGIAINRWFHIAGTHLQQTTTHIYINGNDETLINILSQTWANGIFPADMAFTIGRDEGSSPNYANGRIAEVAVWNRVLTQGEISSLAGGADPLTVRPGSIRAYVPIDGMWNPEPDEAYLRHRMLIGAALAKPAEHPPLPYYPRPRPQIRQRLWVAASATAVKDLIGMGWIPHARS